MTSSNTSPSNTPETRTVERQVTALLTRYAEDMPPTVGTETRLRERLAAASAPDTAARARWLRTSRPGAPHGAGGWARGAVSVGLVAALIVGFFVVARLRNDATSPGPGVSSGPCTEIIGKDHVPNLCPPPSPVKTAIAVTQSYADPTRTALELRITTPGALIPHDHPVVYSQPDSLEIQATLEDSKGNIYGGAMGLPFGPFMYADGQDVATDFYEFDPLPESALAAPQTLTLRIVAIALLYQQQFAIRVKNPQPITFQVTPHAGRSVSFHVAPQTHGGVTVQPLRLDIGPDTSGFERYYGSAEFPGGGARLILRISGLPPTANLSALSAMSTSVTGPNGSGADSQLAEQLLFEGRSPATVAGGDRSNPDATVGPTGTVELEIIFMAPPLRSLTGTQTLTLDQINVTVDPTNNSTKTVKGPWVFQIPLD